MNKNHDENIELTDVIKKELDLRLERRDKGLGKYYTWEEVKTLLAKNREKH